MISVILPTRNDETALAHTLAALVPAAADGAIREVIIVDDDSKDGTLIVADAAGCRLVPGGETLGDDLARAAREARSEWLFFLSPRAMMEPGWQREAHDFIDRVSMSPPDDARAAVFRQARPEFGFAARLAECGAAIRARLFGAPTLADGLLLPAHLYRAVGGHRAARAADVDLARRIGRRRLVFLRARVLVRGAKPRQEAAETGLNRRAAAG